MAERSSGTGGSPLRAGPFCLNVGKASPALYLIDRQGQVRISPTSESLEQWIKNLLKE